MREGGLNLEPRGYFCVCLPGFGVLVAPRLTLGGFFFNMMEDYKHGALKKLQNHVHTVPRRWGRGDRGRAGHEGRGQSCPVGEHMGRGEQLYLIIKCVGPRGWGDGRRDYIYMYVCIYIIFFRSGKDYRSPFGNRGEGDGGRARVIINGDYFCPYTFPARISAAKSRRFRRVAARPDRAVQSRQTMGGERDTHRNAPAALRAGLQGAEEPGTRVRGEAGRGVAQPGLGPAASQLRSPTRGARSAPCSPLVSPFPSLLPHDPRVPSLRWGMPFRRTGLGPSNGSCSTAPRETAAPRRPGAGPRLPFPAGVGRRKGQEQG